MGIRHPAAGRSLSKLKKNSAVPAHSTKNPQRNGQKIRQSSAGRLPILGLTAIHPKHQTKIFKKTNRFSPSQVSTQFEPRSISQEGSPQEIKKNSRPLRQQCRRPPRWTPTPAAAGPHSHARGTGWPAAPSPGNGASRSPGECLWRVTPSRYTTTLEKNPGAIDSISSTGIKTFQLRLNLLPWTDGEKSSAQQHSGPPLSSR